MKSKLTENNILKKVTKGLHTQSPTSGISATTESILNDDVNIIDFPGIRQTIYTTEPIFQKPENVNSIPIYRVLDRSGNILDHTQEPQLSREVVQKMYRNMVQLSIMDKILYESQRQGRISFYMTNYGEEATQVMLLGSIDKIRFAQIDTHII